MPVSSGAMTTLVRVTGASPDLVGSIVVTMVEDRRVVDLEVSDEESDLVVDSSVDEESEDSVLDELEERVDDDDDEEEEEPDVVVVSLLVEESETDDEVDETVDEGVVEVVLMLTGRIENVSSFPAAAGNRRSMWWWGPNVPGDRLMSPEPLARTAMGARRRAARVVGSILDDAKVPNWVCIGARRGCREEKRVKRARRRSGRSSGGFVLYRLHGPWLGDVIYRDGRQVRYMGKESEGHEQKSNGSGVTGAGGGQGFISIPVPPVSSASRKRRHQRRLSMGQDGFAARDEAGQVGMNRGQR